MLKLNIMNKIIEYTAIAYDAKSFTTECNVQIKKGWEPFGGVSVSFGTRIIPNSRPQRNETYALYAQAFVKYHS